MTKASVATQRHALTYETSGGQAWCCAVTEAPPSPRVSVSVVRGPPWWAGAWLASTPQGTPPDARTHHPAGSHPESHQTFPDFRDKKYRPI